MSWSLHFCYILVLPVRFLEVCFQECGTPHIFIPLLFLLPLASVRDAFLLLCLFHSYYYISSCCTFFTSFEPCLPQFFFIYVVKEWKETVGVIYDNIIVSI